ncbi:MAG: hypothetical protein P8Y21_14105, partial [Gemmatimonadales bacterium]
MGQRRGDDRAAPTLVEGEVLLLAGHELACGSVTAARRPTTSVHPVEGPEDVDRDREDRRRVVLRGDLGERLEVAELERHLLRG